MFIAPQITTEGALRIIEMQINAMRPNAPLGIWLYIRPHKKIRSYQQNRYLRAVLQNIVKFGQDTGFRPEGVPKWAMRAEILHEFFKALYGTESTAKLSTKEFGEYVDRLQADMITQSQGMYQPIIPDDPYMASLENRKGEHHA